MDYYIGSIWSYGFGWAPRGTAECNGQLLSIADNQALFSLIGTIYGGDGVQTFALPNMQGRVPIGAGTGPGLPTYVVGQVGGSETVTLNTSNLPSHSHPLLTAQLPASSRDGETGDPTNNYFGLADSAIGNCYNTTSDVNMASSSGVTGVTGSNIPLNILSPFQVINYCIATEGLYPTRN